MVLDQCPNCGVRHVQTAQRFAEHFKQGDGSATWLIVRCQNAACLQLILIHTKSGKPQQVFPFVAHALDTTASIPTEIRDDFREAGLCLGAGCYKASLVMSRRVLQRALYEQGCKQNKLVEAIDSAVKNNILRKAFHTLADEIRQYGNLGAHPDDDQLQNASQESAAQVLDFARLLIHEFYEVPASAAALKRNREHPSGP